MSLTKLIEGAVLAISLLAISPQIGKTETVEIPYSKPQRKMPKENRQAIIYSKIEYNFKQKENKNKYR